MPDDSDHDIRKLTLAALGLSSPSDTERFRKELAQFPELESRRQQAQGQTLIEEREAAGYPARKRCFDIALSIACLVLVSPILLSVSLLVRLNDRGPALTKRKVLGKNREPFVMYGFRCMHWTLHTWFEPSKEDSDKHQFADQGPVFKLKPDPRFTRVGRLILRLGIRDLPAIWNVLRGEMSLVGPPIAFYQITELVAAEHPSLLDRFQVLPGLLSLQSVTIGRISEWRDAVATDLFYVRHATMYTDTKIIAAAILIFFRVPRNAALHAVKLPTPQAVLRTQTIEEPEVSDAFFNYIADYAKQATALE